MKCLKRSAMKVHPLKVNTQSSVSVDATEITFHQYARAGKESELQDEINQIKKQIEDKELLKILNQHDENKLSALHYAAKYNHLNVVQLLVGKGADPNNKDEDGLTPLHYAAKYRRQGNRESEMTGDGDEEREMSEEIEETVITYLIGVADINAITNHGKTALILATMRGNEEAVRDLLGNKTESPDDKAIKINAMDFTGMKALHMAAIYNQVNIAKMLIKAGANILESKDQVSTPLHLCCSEGNLEMAKLLFDAAETPEDISKMLNDVDIDGNTCLHLAIDNNHYEVTELCLEKGANVNTPRKHGMYPMHLAAMLTEDEIVNLLVKHEAELDVLDDEQASPLHKAVHFNRTKIVIFLIDNDADIDSRDEDDCTPLLLAATYGKTKCVELLLDSGADYSAVDKTDKTVIYLACQGNCISTLHQLLSVCEVQEMINIGDEYGNGPLHVAAFEGHLDIFVHLLEKGADLEKKNEKEQTPLHIAAQSGRTHVVKKIVEYCKENPSVVYDKDEYSHTALHLAARFGHNKAVQILIDYGSNVGARDANKRTPLHLAASYGWKKTCEILLKEGAPVNSVDKSNQTPLHLASKFDHPHVVKFLLDWNADVTARDSNTKNSLDVAIDSNNPDVAMAIVSSEVWEKALRNATKDFNTGILDTPMRKLIKKMPLVAKKVCDRCLTHDSPKNPKKDNSTITYNFEYLDDAYVPWVVQTLEDHSTSNDKLCACSSDSDMPKRNHPIMIMVSSNREYLLRHQLVTALLMHKWKSFGRFIYYLFLMIFVVFLTFLTGYIVFVEPPYKFNQTEADLIISGNCTIDSQTIQKPVFAKIGKWVILFLSVFHILKEVLQICQAKFNYISWTNLIEWTTFITAILLVIDFTDCQEQTGYRYPWQWSLGSISIFCAWMDLISFIQKFPLLGIYVVMLTEVIKTFAKFSIVFLLFIVAFALSFFALFQNQVAFRGVGHSVMKTSVMMIGELEFDDIFNSKVTSDDVEDKLYMPEVSYILFIIFLILMSILIMNLLVGLAVDDIKAVQEKAIFTRKAMQVEHVLSVERILPNALKKKFYIQSKIMLHPISNYFKGKSSAVTETSNPEQKEKDILEETQEKIKFDIKKLKKASKDMREQNSRIESMLSAIINNDRDISWQEEDFTDDDGLEPTMTPWSDDYPNDYPDDYPDD